MRLSSSTFGAASLLSAPAAPLDGQMVTLVGLVSDSMSGAPIWNVEATVPGTTLQGLTDTAGVFRIRGVRPGSHVLELDSWGFAHRTFSFT